MHAVLGRTDLLPPATAASFRSQLHTLGSLPPEWRGDRRGCEVVIMR
jgi:hypothetical protein